jgi:hypothetical protein
VSRRGFYDAHVKTIPNGDKLDSSSTSGKGKESERERERESEREREFLREMSDVGFCFRSQRAAPRLCSMAIFRDNLLSFPLSSPSCPPPAPLPLALLVYDLTIQQLSKVTRERIASLKKRINGAAKCRCTFRAGPATHSQAHSRGFYREQDRIEQHLRKRFKKLGSFYTPPCITIGARK